MKNRWTIVMGALTIAGSIALGEPAFAQDCELGPAPGVTFIEHTPQGTGIYPDRIGNDAGAFAGWATDYVACLEGGSVERITTRVESCLSSIVEGHPTVTYDPETGAIYIDHGDRRCPVKDPEG